MSLPPVDYSDLVYWRTVTPYNSVGVYEAITLVRQQQARSDYYDATTGREGERAFALIPEPDNDNDPEAIRIDGVIDGTGYSIGYLPRMDTKIDYFRELMPLAVLGIYGAVEGRMWKGDRGGWRINVNLGPAPDLTKAPYGA